MVGFIYCGGDRHGGADALAQVYPYNAAIPSSVLAQTNCKGSPKRDCAPTRRVSKRAGMGRSDQGLRDVGAMGA
jgi:hypothetical protein